jgi:hypothetical protein
MDKHRRFIAELQQLSNANGYRKRRRTGAGIPAKQLWMYPNG